MLPRDSRINAFCEHANLKRVRHALAHQFLSQFNERRADALSATGSTIIFNVGRKDAGQLTKDLRALWSRGEDFRRIPRSTPLGSS